MESKAIAFFAKMGITLGSEPDSKVMTITPELAKQMLEFNTHNRHASRQLIGHLVKIFTNGKWILNGASVKFDIMGTLLDAQHRLMACIASGTPFRTFVTFNLPVEAFKTLGTDKPRSGADVLSIEGYKNSRTTASTIRNIFMLKGGAMSSYRITNDEILDFVEEHPEILEAVEFGHKYYDIGDRLVPPSWLATTLFLLSKIDKEEAHQFVYDLATGVELSANDWVYKVRQRIGIVQRSNTKSMTKVGLANHIFHAWKLRRSGAKIKTLRIPFKELIDVSKLN